MSLNKKAMTGRTLLTLIILVLLLALLIYLIYTYGTKPAEKTIKAVTACDTEFQQCACVFPDDKCPATAWGKGQKRPDCPPDKWGEKAGQTPSCEEGLSEALTAAHKWYKEKGEKWEGGTCCLITKQI